MCACAVEERDDREGEKEAWRGKEGKERAGARRRRPLNPEAEHLSCCLARGPPQAFPLSRAVPEGPAPLLTLGAKRARPGSVVPAKATGKPVLPAPGAWPGSPSRRWWWPGRAWRGERGLWGG